MSAWHRAPHTAPWFSATTVDLVAAEYEPCIDGTDPTRVHVLEIDGAPCGYLQHYLVRDNASYLEGVGDPDAAAIDFIIGEPDLIGKGLGPRVIRDYIETVVVSAYPDVPRVVSTPDPRNVRSIRALEKAGFVPGAVVRVEGKPERLCVLHLSGRGTGLSEPSD